MMVRILQTQIFEACLECLEYAAEVTIETQGSDGVEEIADSL